MMLRTITTKQRKDSKEPGQLAGLRFAVYSRKSTDDARHEDHCGLERTIFLKLPDEEEAWGPN